VSTQERHPQLAKIEVHRLFRQFQVDRSPEIRRTLIEGHLGLVEYLARRFAGRGEPLDDLVQVATIGLVKAVDRFDPDRAVEFSTYATPTIVGELKRHFRDKGWALRVPRRLQELNLRLGSVIGKLSQELQRSPTVAEIAKAAGTTEDEILEGLDSAHAYRLISLDAPASDEGLTYHEQLGDQDSSLAALDDWISVRPLVQQLPPRERRMLYLRFFKGLTQSEIADQLGISQMHVSRLLAKTLSVLREGHIPIHEEGLQSAVNLALAEGRLEILDAPPSEPPDLALICVGTPIGDDGLIDLGQLRSALADVGPMLEAGTTLVIRSTLPVGTTRMVVSEAGIPLARTFTNPEFLRQGTALADFRAPARAIVGRFPEADPEAQAVSRRRT